MAHSLTARARTGLVLATVSCLVVGAYGLALVASGFALLPAEIQANGLLLVLRIHIVTSSLALVVIPWQVWPGIRRHRPVHRWLGRGYVAAALAGGLSGFAAGVTTANGPVAGAGLALLGLAWTATTLAAFLAARRRDVTSHRRWAVRSFALALAAVTLRVYLPTAQLLGAPFAEVYPIIVWLCWVPNVVIAELVLRTRGVVREKSPIAAA